MQTNDASPRPPLQPGDATGRHPRFRLDRCREVSVCDLSGAERFIVWAIRWRASTDDSDAFADSCLEDAFDRAGLHDVQPAFEGFMEVSCPLAATCGAAERLGCWRLKPLEAHALHAIACLQSGLLGEAWKALGCVCARRQVGRALACLEELAGALDRIGGRIERWQFDESRRALPAS
jgi:hypothetical protein